MLSAKKRSAIAKTYRGGRRRKEPGATRPAPIVVPITTLGPTRPFELVRDLPIVVQPTDHGFTATFFDANVSMSGDTQEEAVENLKDILIDLLEDLGSEPTRKLGPEPARQLQILKAVIRKTR